MQRRLLLATPAAAVLVLAALGGCSSTVEGVASRSATTTSAVGSTAPTSGDGEVRDASELADGLLPADAFGSGVTVTPVSADDVGAGTGIGGALAGATVTPESCRAALRSAQLSGTGAGILAGQTVTTHDTTSVEVLTVGETGNRVADVAAAAATCPEVDISFPQTTGTMTMTLDTLQLPDLGDGTAGLADTMTVHGADGHELVVPMLLAVVADGDRVLTVLTTLAGEGGTVDQAAFTALVQQAYEYQADQLD